MRLKLMSDRHILREILFKLVVNASYFEEKATRLLGE
jgi:hypothetical protein